MKRKHDGNTADREIEVAQVEKQSKIDNDDGEKPRMTYEELLPFVNSISKPMATRKLTKKLYKLLKKACGSEKKKDLVIFGKKNVSTALRKGFKGLVIIAGDVYPIEIVCHLPIVCEDLNLPYVFVPSRADLALAMGRHGSLLCAVIAKNELYEELYDDCVDRIDNLLTSN